MPGSDILFANSVPFLDLGFPMDSLRQRKAASISARSRPIAQLDLAHVAPRSALERAVRQTASPDGVDCRTLRPKLTVEMCADHVLWPQRVRVWAIALHQQCVDVLDLARLEPMQEAPQVPLPHDPRLRDRLGRGVALVNQGSGGWWWAPFGTCSPW